MSIGEGSLVFLVWLPLMRKRLSILAILAVRSLGRGLKGSIATTARNLVILLPIITTYTLLSGLAVFRRVVIGVIVAISLLAISLLAIGLLEVIG